MGKRRGDVVGGYGECELKSGAKALEVATMACAG